MMSNELKSAWEVALEKLQAQGNIVEKLSAQKKETIAEIRRKYQAKVAEAEISAQSQLKKALQAGVADEVDTIRQKLVGKKQRCNQQMEKEISEARKGPT